MLLNRIANPPNKRPSFGKLRIALFLIVFELALIAVTLEMVGRLREGGMAAPDGQGGSALRFALGAGIAAVIEPVVGWILVRAMD